MGSTQYIQILIRVLFIISNGVIIFISYTKGYIINTIGFSLLLLFQVFLLLNYLKNIFSDIEKSLDCLLFEDYSNSISKKKRKIPIYDKTSLLLKKHRKLSLQKTSEELIFTNIIESLSIGLLILRKDAQNSIDIFQINTSFVDFLKIPKFYSWKLLENKIGPLRNYILKWERIKHTITLSINNEKETFFFKTSVTKTNEYEYLIITLETIQQLIDKKEKESWYKLMNVMSHEIINTITPISSLAENLDTLILDDELDKDSKDELSQGLKIIKKRSYHLTSFVDTYRKLAELPLPNKKEENLTSIVLSTLSLFEQELKQKKVTLLFNSDKSFLINADGKQIEQVIINLLSNSLYAIEHLENPKISIQISADNTRTNLSITDNGVGIPDEIKDNIFVPYFTTRKNGSGIGLTLSKSIIESHNGLIQFSSIPNRTIFTVILIQ